MFSPDALSLWRMRVVEEEGEGQGEPDTTIESVHVPFIATVFRNTHRACAALE